MARRKLHAWWRGAVWILLGTTIATAQITDNEIQPETEDGNPFAAVLPTGSTTIQGGFDHPIDAEEGMPPILQHQMVQLNYLDAEEAATAFSSLCSPAGKIVTQKLSNTLHVFDTDAYLHRVVKEIQDADVPTGSLTVKTLTLRFVDAKSAQTALEKLVSEDGSISAIDRSNTLVITDYERNIKAIEREVVKLDQSHNGLEVVTVNLKFLEAANLEPVIGRLLTAYGLVASNVNSNSLIICDVPENLPRILEEIRKADRTPQQIMIEVVLLDVQLTDDSEIGVNWDMLTHDISDVSYRQNLTGRVTSTLSDDSTRGNATVYNSAGAVAGNLGIVVGNVRGVIHLIQEKRDVEIIASPRALVVSGQTATIKAVEEIPYQQIMDTSQGGQEAVSSTAFKEVGVIMEVTATITDTNEVYVKVRTEQNVRTGQSSDDIPVVDTRSEDTSLLLKDGETVIMGGLRRHEVIQFVDKIPLLGDIPLLGALFRRHIDVAEDSELVVLLSPHIYRGEPVDETTRAKVEVLKDRSRFKDMNKQKWRRCLQP